MATRHDVMWGFGGLLMLGGYFAFAWSDAPTERPPKALTAAERAEQGFDRKIAFHEHRLQAQPSAWLHLDMVAAAQLGLAHLRGSYDPYDKAEDALRAAYTQAPAGAGPHLTRARLAFTLHRFDRVEPALRRVERALVIDSDVRRAVAELRAALAFQRGDLAAAEATLVRLIDERPTVTALARLAQVRWKSGDFARAEAGFVAALALAPSSDGERRAWLELMRGLLDLDRDRFDEALAHYRAADAAFSGWYLVEEHIAEIHARKGEHERARRQYERLVARTNNPELMDALAATYAALGRSADARNMTARARRAYEAQLTKYPEASYGHALDHFLDAGDVARSVALAEKNAALRPNGEALAALAMAYHRAGRHDDATAVLDRAMNTAWRTPAIYATAADIFGATGATARAASARAAYGRLVGGGPRP